MSRLGGLVTLDPPPRYDEVYQEAVRRMDRVDWAKDEIVTNTTFHFSLADRLRLLLGWQLHFQTHVATEELPGRMEVISEQMLLMKPRWFPRKRRPEGYAEAHGER